MKLLLVLFVCFFFEEEKHDLFPLHNSKLHRKTTVHNLTETDDTWKLKFQLTAVYFSEQNSAFVTGFIQNLYILS